MKKPFLLSFMAVLTILLIVSFTKPLVSEKEDFKTKIERWQLIDMEEISSSLYNEELQLLKSITLTKSQIEILLSDPSKEQIELELAIDETGAFQFIINKAVVAGNHSFLSELEDFKEGLKTFDQDVYLTTNETLDPKALEHLIALAPAIEEIENWQSANQSQLVEAFYVNKGTRIRSLSYNREVLEAILAQEHVTSVTSFLALNNEGQISLVSIARDSEENLMIYPTTHKSGVAIFNFLHPCPPFCDPPSCVDIVCPEGQVCENGKCKPSNQ